MNDTVKQDLELELINLSKFMTGFPVLETAEDAMTHKRDLDVLLVTLQHINNYIQTLMVPTSEAVQPQDSSVLGDSTEVTFVTLRGHNLKGKVDTGADVSSLHVDHWHIDNVKKTVSFSSKALTGGDTVITLPLQDQQAVKSAGNGVKYRPIIALDVKINGKLLNNVLFNLSDRTGMEYPVLVGKNILERGKFTINPSHENVDNMKEKIIEAMKLVFETDVSMKEAFAWYTASKHD